MGKKDNIKGRSFNRSGTNKNSSSAQKNDRNKQQDNSNKVSEQRKSKNLDYKFNKEYYECDIFRKEDGGLHSSYEEIEALGEEKLKSILDKAHEQIIALSKNYPEDYRDLWLYQLKSVKEKQKHTEDTNRTFQYFKLKIGYPGLLIGLGNPHGTAFKGDIQLGMSFDYVTGLPFVSGSSLKGKLRSIMAKMINETAKECRSIPEEDLTNKESSEDRIKEITLGDYLNVCSKKEQAADQKNNAQKLSNLQINELIDQIFEGLYWEKDPNNDPSQNGPGQPRKEAYIKKEIPMGDRDIFYGGIVVPGKNKAFLKQDHLAPHPSKTQSPNVLKFLAIAPETEIEFFFSLKDSELKSEQEKITITADQKKEMFFNLLKDFGVGAKTNVGYGIME